jgi:hypothetical protein
MQAHVSTQKTVKKFVGRMIELAWNGCLQPRVRNALAQTAMYVDIKYPMQNVPLKPSVTRLAVLGTPEERRDIFKLLNPRKNDEI